jgi:hypothetical protein
MQLLVDSDILEPWPAYSRCLDSCNRNQLLMSSTFEKPEGLSVDARHSGESRNPALAHYAHSWIPVFTGMTGKKYLSS